MKIDVKGKMMPIRAYSVLLKMVTVYGKDINPTAFQLVLTTCGNSNISFDKSKKQIILGSRFTRFKSSKIVILKKLMKRYIIKQNKQKINQLVG